MAEAAFAIILLASMILVMIGKQAERQDISEAMYRLQHNILDEASRNETIRNAALSEDAPKVESFIRYRLPAGMNFTVKICNLPELCDAELPESEIYVSDVLISSTMQEYLPKKLRLFVWIE